MNVKLKVAILEKYRVQADLAKDTGIPESQISRIIHERRNAWPDEKEAIAAALGVSPEEIFPAE